MPKSTVPIRVHESHLARVEALIPLVQADDEIAIYGDVKRATVLRLILHSGIKELERQLGLPGGTSPAPLKKFRVKKQRARDDRQRTIKSISLTIPDWLSIRAFRLAEVMYSRASSTLPVKRKITRVWIFRIAIYLGLKEFEERYPVPGRGPLIESIAHKEFLGLIDEGANQLEARAREEARQFLENLDGVLSGPSISEDEFLERLGLSFKKEETHAPETPPDDHGEQP